MPLPACFLASRLTMTPIPKALSTGWKHWRSGQLEQAEQIARQILNAERGNAAAMDLLGSVCQGRGRFVEAATWHAQAVQLQPDCAAARDRLACALAAQGKTGEAIASWRRAVSLQPDLAETHYSLGKAYRLQGQVADAAACLARAVQLRPDSAEARNTLGLTLASQGRPAQAVEHFRHATRLRPENARMWHNLGTALLESGKPKEAADCLRRAIQLLPELVDAHNNLGKALEKQERLQEAADCFEQALRLKPDFADADNNLGAIRARQDRLPEATTRFRQAVLLDPQHAEAHGNLGLAALQQGHLAEAVAGFTRSVQLRPDNADARNNLGHALRLQGRFAEAMACFEKALQTTPNHPGARLNRALLLLLQGHWQQGWSEYEWRWQEPDRKLPAFPRPAWDGTPLAGRRILLHTEQGIGDTVQFVRYAGLLKQQGATVFLACPPNLVRLLSRCQGIDQVIAKGMAPPAFDVHAPLLSLPRLLGTSPATVPAQVPYLTPEPALAERWRQEFNADPSFKVGIAWQGSGKHREDRFRSMPLAEFAPLAVVSGVRLISLQKGPGTEQLATVRERFPVTDLGSQLDDATGTLVETAAVVGNLDLIISCDSAVAHLAGALGVPAWAALALVPDWRCVLGREDTPWYPSMRLFRQTELGKWQPVFERMAAELHARVQGTGRGALGRADTSSQAPVSRHPGAAASSVSLEGFGMAAPET